MKNNNNQLELSLKEKYEKSQRELREKNRELESSKFRYKNQKNTRRRVEEEVKQAKLETKNVKKVSAKALLIEKLMVKYWKKQAEREEENAVSHFKAIKACENWYTKHPGCLKEQLSDKAEKLEKANSTLSEQKELIDKLRQELEEKTEKLNLANEEIRGKEILISKLQRQKTLKRKRDNIQQEGREKKVKLQQSFEKKQSQELTTSIEIPAKHNN